MPFTYFTSNKILDHYTAKTQYGYPPSSGGVYVGLSSTAPTPGGANVTEPSSGSYARVQISGAQFNTAANGATETNVDKSFPQATGDWLSGTNLAYLVIYDASTSGNLLGYATLTTPKNVLSGDTAKILSGELDLVIS